MQHGLKEISFSALAVKSNTMALIMYNIKTLKCKMVQKLMIFSAALIIKINIKNFQTVNMEID